MSVNHQINAPVLPAGQSDVGIFSTEVFSDVFSVCQVDNKLVLTVPEGWHSTLLLFSSLWSYIRDGWDQKGTQRWFRSRGNMKYV